MVINEFASEARAQEVDTFFKSHKGPERTVKQALEIIRAYYKYM